MDTRQKKQAETEQEVIYLGLGSNMGERRENLVQALQKLQKYIYIEQISSLYETEPVGYKEQNLFLNLVCQGQTAYTAAEILQQAKLIEEKMGREPTFRNGPRPIDIDILLYGTHIIKQKRLIIPHPRMAERAFVLIPLREIAPDALEPETNRTIGQLAQDIPAQGIARYNITRQITLAEIKQNETV